MGILKTIVNLIGDIKKILERECTFCGSRKNVKSTIVNTILYFYCDKKECISKMREIEKNRIFK